MKRAKLEQLVRGMLKDRAIQNRLAGYKLRYEPEDFDSAIALALLDINYKYVPTSLYTIEDAQDRLIVLGVASKLMASENILKASNYITVAEGGMQINREANLSILMNMAQAMAIEFDKSLQAYKYGANLEAGWGH